MAYICSIGLGVPIHEVTQKQVKQFVREIFPLSERKLTKVMPIFDNALIHTRQLAVTPQWLKKGQSFKERNEKYERLALTYCLKAIDQCLLNPMLKEKVPYEAIDMIAYVSSTGLTTPSLDAHILNERPFREDVVRMPLWGLGCGGGANGLARAAEYVKAFPEKVALLVCCELCSLTFQKDDLSMKNVVGTALFGDGIAAVLVIGEKSPYLSYRQKVVPKIKQTSTFTRKGTLQVMGWKVRDSGFEVIFSKRIPKLIHSLWKKHMESFLEEIQTNEDKTHSFIIHPGGRKVLESMEQSLQLSKDQLKHSYQVLAQHGNMSSATVLYVLNNWLKEEVLQGEVSILSALGPGFSSELLELEWV